MTIAEQVEALKEAESIQCAYARIKVKELLKGMEYEETNSGFFVQTKPEKFFNIYIAYYKASKCVEVRVYNCDQYRKKYNEAPLLAAAPDKFGELFADYLFRNSLI